MLIFLFPAKCLYAVTWIVKHDFFLLHFGNERSIFAGIVDSVHAQNHVYRVIFMPFVRDFYRDSKTIFRIR